MGVRSSIVSKAPERLDRHLGERFAVAGGLLGSLAATSCCILPLALFSIGASGAWIGNLTALAPYQPFFVALTLGSLGYGYWLVYWRPRAACAEGMPAPEECRTVWSSSGFGLRQSPSPPRWPSHLWLPFCSKSELE